GGHGGATGSVGARGARRGGRAQGAGDPARGARRRARSRRGAESRRARPGVRRPRAAMNILVTGITGYVGSRLAPRLARDGHAVRGFTRRDASLAFPLFRGDVVSGEGLEQALEGVEVAYFLIHSMETSLDDSFPARERRAG